MTIEVTGAVTAKIGFASHQNSVPLLRELEIFNRSADTFDGLELSISSDPIFLEPKSWVIDRLAPDSVLHIAERDLRLNAALLGDLSESVRGEVKLRLKQGEVELASTAFPVELLARSEWGGALAMPELLAAFCMPNDPAVDKILKAASDVLRRAGKPDGLDGYESGSRSRVWELVSAIWSAVAGFEVSYALPPASFEAQGQKVRTPTAILDGRVATCLDTALLFAAACEQAGLNPVLVLTCGHAFVGVWLQPQEFSQITTDEAAAVRKRFDLDELLLFETTLVTKAPVPRFDQAVAAARRQVAEDAEANFVVAVDIRIAPQPDLEAGGRDAKLYEQQTAESLIEQFAKAALDKGEVLSSLEKPKLEATLTFIGRVDHSAARRQPRDRASALSSMTMPPSLRGRTMPISTPS